MKPHDRMISIDEKDRDPTSYIASARNLKQLGRLEETLDTLRLGIAKCAPSVSLYEYFIERLEKCNQTAEAIAAAQSASALFPEHLIFKFWSHLLLPVVYRNSEEVDYYRRRYSEGLAQLTEQFSLQTQDESRRALEAIGKYVNYYLGYQGEDVLADQRRYGELISRVMTANYPQWTKALAMPEPAEDTRVRIGFVSSVFFEHSTVMKIYIGWLRELNPKKVSLHCYHVGKKSDLVTEEVQRLSDRFLHLPNDLEGTAEAILADRLHALVYLDIGLRPITAQLAGLRLASIQCATMEAPLTTGLPTVDYYLSSELMEPEAGQRHYSERLVRLPGVGMCYQKPVIPSIILTKTRADFGLPGEATIYLCCQSLSKILPQHDDIFLRIVQRVPNAYFVFISPNRLVAGVLEQRLEARFSKANLIAKDFYTVLPSLDLLDYWNLHLVSDVYLDTIEWSGNISTCEALACKVPVVTTPGKFMRGRHSFALLQELGVTETIAADKDEYVEIAARLGSDSEWRMSVVTRIVDGYSRLFSDTSSVRALEQLVRTAVSKSNP